MDENIIEELRHIRSKIDEITRCVTIQESLNTGFAKAHSEMLSSMQRLCKVIENLQSRVLKIETERKTAWRWIMVGASTASGCIMIGLGAAQVLITMYGGK